jgi:hypothetical protein
MVSADSIVVELGENAASEPIFQCKLQFAWCEVNLLIPPPDIHTVKDMLGYDPQAHEQSAPNIGVAAGAKVFLVPAELNSETYYLLIGEDDITWHIGITTNRATVVALLKELVNCAKLNNVKITKR